VEWEGAYPGTVILDSRFRGNDVRVGVGVGGDALVMLYTGDRDGFATKVTTFAKRKERILNTGVRMRYTRDIYANVRGNPRAEAREGGRTPEPKVQGVNPGGIGMGGVGVAGSAWVAGLPSCTWGHGDEKHPLTS